MKRRTAIVMVATVIAVVALFDGALRLAAARIEDPLLYWNWEAQHKIESMDALGKKGGASVVFVGSSIMQTVNPRLVTRALSLERPAFNAALNGSGMQAWELWIRSVVVPRLRPDVIVLGFNAEGLNDHGIQQKQYYESMITSPYGARLDGRGRLVDRIEGWWAARSYLIRYRSLLRRPWSAIQNRHKNDRRGAATEAGTLATITEFMSRPYKAQPPGLVPGWRRQFNDYTPGGSMLTRLDDLKRFLDGEGIRLLLVRMPISRDIVGVQPTWETDRQRFASVIDPFIREKGIASFDAEAALGSSPEIFVDSVHLNRRGSDLISAQLAEALRPLLR